MLRISNRKFIIFLILLIAANYKFLWPTQRKKKKKKKKKTFKMSKKKTIYLYSLLSLSALMLLWANVRLNWTPYRYSYIKTHVTDKFAHKSHKKRSRFGIL